MFSNNFRLREEVQKSCREFPFSSLPKCCPLSPWHISGVQRRLSGGFRAVWRPDWPDGCCPSLREPRPFPQLPAGVCAPLFRELRAPVLQPESGLALVSAGCPWACPRAEAPSLCGVGGSLRGARLPALGNVPSGPSVFLRLRVQQALWREQGRHQCLPRPRLTVGSRPVCRSHSCRLRFSYACARPSISDGVLKP